MKLITITLLNLNQVSYVPIYPYSSLMDSYIFDLLSYLLIDFSCILSILVYRVLSIMSTFTYFMSLYTLMFDSGRVGPGQKGVGQIGLHTYFSATKIILMSPDQIMP